MPLPVIIMVTKPPTAALLQTPPCLLQAPGLVAAQAKPQVSSMLVERRAVSRHAPPCHPAYIPCRQPSPMREVNTSLYIVSAMLIC